MVLTTWQDGVALSVLLLFLINPLNSTKVLVLQQTAICSSGQISRQFRQDLASHLEGQ